MRTRVVIRRTRLIRAERSVRDDQSERSAKLEAIIALPWRSTAPEVPGPVRLVWL